jgi:hypothetical protein
MFFTLNMPQTAGTVHHYIHVMNMPLEKQVYSLQGHASIFRVETEDGGNKFFEILVPMSA